MKQSDRFLIGIVVSILLLVAIAIIAVLRQSEPAFLPDDRPDNIAHNYLLALQRQEYERAYSYLSPTLKNYPPDVHAFKNNLTAYRWRFDFPEEELLSIAATEINDDEAIVTVQATRFEQTGPFESGTSTDHFDMALQQEADGWKLWSAEKYWAPCWNRGEGCP